MVQVFGQDQKRIDHAMAVLELAERIQAAEGADPAVVQAAAILHDIGIHQAQLKYNSTAGIYQQIEGPPIARSILEGLGWPAEQIDHVCKIIASHHTADLIDTPELRCVWDADWIVNLGTDYASWPIEAKRHTVAVVLRTETGRQIARSRYLG
jgi:putative nucleotidyltransferase with HDIG domain